MSPDFLAEMGWKSAVISALALVALVPLRSRSALDRAAVLRVAVALLLLLPLVSTFMPALEVERPASVEPVESLQAELDGGYAAVEAADEELGAPLVLQAREDGEASAWSSVPAVLSVIYIGGALLVLARLLAGVGTLARWTAGAHEVTSPAWRYALRRAKAGSALDVRLLVSDAAPSPLSWGVRAPVILIDRASLGRPEDAEAILAHEMAHIVRRDWPMLMLSRLAVALFWFNPLVWLVQRALVQQAEEAADLRAVRRLEPTDYALALVSSFCSIKGAALPANSMASGHGLTRRVRMVLDEAQRSTPSGSLWTGATIAACLAVSATIAALEVVPAHANGVTSRIPDAPGEFTAVVLPEVAVVVAPTPEVVPVPPALPRPGAGLALQRPPQPPAVPAVRPIGPQRAVPPVPAVPAPPVVDVDTLIEMKVHGLDPEHIAELRAMGGRFARLSPDELVEMRVFGLTPAKLRQWADLGYGDVDHDDLVAMAVHGISADYVRAMAAAGYPKLDADDLVAMKIHGVTPDYARRANMGGGRLSPDELVERRILGER